MVVGKWVTAGLDPDIYIDISEEDDPVRPILTLEIYNGGPQDLYIKLEAEGPEEWAFTPVELGQFPAGGKRTVTVENWAQRPLPGTELTETITLHLKCYTDSGYTDYLGEVRQSLNVHFIDLEAMMVVDDDDFTENTEGWSVGSLASDHYVTPPSSLYRDGTVISSGWSVSECEYESNLLVTYKSYDIPEAGEAFVCLYVRFAHDEIWPELSLVERYVAVEVNDKTVLFATEPDKWYKVVTPIPVNTTVTVRVKAYLNVHAEASFTASEDLDVKLWVDHVRVRYR